MNGPRQLAFDLGTAPGVADDTFLIGAHNAQAADAVSRWPRWRHPMLLLVGPEASGKTHLARGWAARAGAPVVPLSDLTADAVPRLAAAPALVLDDAPEGLVDETTFFHLYNALRETGASVLLTSCVPASAWGLRLADLRSRLGTVPCVGLGTPDDAFLGQLVLKLFADRQVEVEPEVIAYSLSRMERSQAGALRLVAAADRLALAAKRPVTRALVLEALRDLERDEAA